ncbi:MAG TPA: ABC transporter substrate-binding protein [Melioribacteraceae bacterium]|nr:ABC transporter substrate-binding protein [Melioribacteraceae bacterium]
MIIEYLSKKILFIIFYTVITIFITVPFLHAASKNKQQKPVTLQLKWKHQFQFAGYYAAIEEGFYKNFGIEVNLIEADGTNNPADAVFEGKADFGITTSDILIMRSQKKDAVILASIFQHSAQILLASKQSGIRNVHDLKGKRIALEPNAIDIITYLNNEGISLDECIIEKHSFNADALLENRIDAITAYVTDEPYVLQKSKFDFIIISPMMGGIDFYGDVLFTSEELIKNYPKLVENFRKASLQGWKYAMENQEEMIEIIYNKYSQRHTKEHLRFEARHMKNLIMADVVELGYSNPGRWESILNIYKNKKKIHPSFTLNGLFYTDYIKLKTNIPWKIIIIFSLVLIIFGAAAYYYYYISKKLKAEIQKRIRVQTELFKLNEELQIAKLRDEENLFQRNVVIQELSEIKEKLEKTNLAKDKFFSIIAHDLKSPLFGLLGMTEIMAEESNSFNLKEYSSMSKNLHKTTYNIFKLLENLLEWSRMQVGDISFSPQIANLFNIVNKNIEIISPRAIQKGINIINEISETQFIYGDEKMIDTILRNLLSNSVKFTKQNGKITIKAKIIENEFVEISIADTGIGMSEELRNKLFKIEEKVGRNGTDGEASTGLGLLICKEFIEKHGGKIWVTSKENIGSVFYFYLPTKTII